MIDIWGILANGLWILGLAVLLAALSWAHWAASTGRVRFRAVLCWPWLRRVVSLGLVLFCLGLMMTGRTWWERALWVALTVAWMAQAWLADTKTLGVPENPKGSTEEE